MKAPAGKGVAYLVNLCINVHVYGWSSFSNDLTLEAAISSKRCLSSPPVTGRLNAFTHGGASNYAPFVHGLICV